MNPHKRRLRFYCDESGQTGTHWLDETQPVVVHGGWLFAEDSESKVTAGIDQIRRRYRLNAPELKWAQFTRPSRSTAFREVFELCLTNGVVPIFMVMDKRYAIAAKVIETFFDPLYNRHLTMGFTGDFDAKKELAEAVMLSPDLLSAFAPWLRRGERPTAVEVRTLAHDLAQHLILAGAQGFASTLADLSEEAIDEVRDEFAAESMMRTTTWTVLWAMAVIVFDFAHENDGEVEILQDEIVRFGPLLEQIRNQPSVSRVELVDSKTHLGVQLADLLCGFVRTVFTKITAGNALDLNERALCADMFMLKLELEVWNGNLPESTWMSFIQLSALEAKQRYGMNRPSSA